MRSLGIIAYRECQPRCSSNTDCPHKTYHQAVTNATRALLLQAAPPMLSAAHKSPARELGISSAGTAVAPRDYDSGVEVVQTTLISGGQARRGRGRCARA